MPSLNQLKGGGGCHDLGHRPDVEERSVRIHSSPSLQIGEPKSSCQDYLASGHDRKHGTWNVSLGHFRRQKAIGERRKRPRIQAVCRRKLLAEC
jgi:hypothetical protein